MCWWTLDRLETTTNWETTKSNSNTVSATAVHKCFSMCLCIHQLHWCLFCSHWCNQLHTKSIIIFQIEIFLNRYYNSNLINFNISNNTTGFRFYAEKLHDKMKFIWLFCTKDLVPISILITSWPWHLNQLHVVCKT